MAMEAKFKKMLPPAVELKSQKNKLVKSQDTLQNQASEKSPTAPISDLFGSKKRQNLGDVEQFEGVPNKGLRAILKQHLPESICSFSELLPWRSDWRWCSRFRCSSAWLDCDRLWEPERKRISICRGKLVSERNTWSPTRTDISVSVSVAVLGIFCHFVRALVGLIPDVLNNNTTTI